MSKNSRPIVFDHLAKTGGQSVNFYAKALYANPRLVTENLNTSHLSALTEFGDTHKFISGHLSFSGEGLFSDYRYLTCLRDPRERAVSWIFFVLQALKSDHPFHVAATRLLTVNNFFSCDVDFRFYQTLFNPYITHFSSVHSDSNLSLDDKYKQAFKAINDYDFIGFFDNFEFFLENIRKMSSTEHVLPVYMPRVNVTLKKIDFEDLDSPIQKIIDSALIYDKDFFNKIKNNSKNKKFVSYFFSRSRHFSKNKIKSIKSFENSCVSLNKFKIIQKDGLLNIECEIRCLIDIRYISLKFVLHNPFTKPVAVYDSPLMMESVLNFDFDSNIFKYSFEFEDVVDFDGFINIIIHDFSVKGVPRTIAKYNNVGHIEASNKVLLNSFFKFPVFKLKLLRIEAIGNKNFPEMRYDSNVNYKSSFASVTTTYLSVDGLLNASFLITNIGDVAIYPTVLNPVWVEGSIFIGSQLYSRVNVLSVTDVIEPGASVYLTALVSSGIVEPGIYTIHYSVRSSERIFSSSEMDSNIKNIKVINKNLNDLQIDPSDDIFHTLVGIRRNNSIFSKRTAGVLLFGPYLSLSAGSFAIHLQYELLEGDISAMQCFIKFNFKNDPSSTRSIGLELLCDSAKVQFSISEDIFNFEVCVVVESDIVVSLNNFKITRTI
jgi:hypothetical protein